MSEPDQNDENTAFESVEPYEAPEVERLIQGLINVVDACLLYTSPSPRDGLLSRMPSSA